jgi:chemotaxis protein histidine kinase CheA
LDDELVNVEGISGASIQGDGRIALVLDAVSLIDLAIKRLRQLKVPKVPKVS